MTDKDRSCVQASVLQLEVRLTRLYQLQVSEAIISGLNEGLDQFNVRVEGTEAYF